ncbi:MAG: carbohydrate binding family 9 domain-containing protein, partial [Thermoanaerobaculia bacterium]|nr:carbohydrate binding family 9 domain-containing protein [Thermoanaerobaculia bacterium]
MKILSFIICLLCCAILLPAQPGKMLEAVRLHCYPEIDGHLNDSCWQRLSALEEFTTSTPVFGETPQCRTEVRLFYTETALYVAAHCYDPDAGGVRRDGGIRDGELTGDWFQVSIDTWNDDRLSFDFTVSAAGIQQDLRDETAWDANWQSAVTLQAGGWTLEMRIPYTALRYPRITEQNWGIQFTRFDRSLGETSTWSPQNPLVQDRVLQFGSLTGLQNIHQEQRHALAIHTNTAYQSPGIFVNSNGLTQSAGIDARLGLSESATLDVTVLPPISVTKSFGSLSFPGDDGLNISGNAPLPAPRQLLAEESGLFQRGAGSLEPNPVISPFQLSRRRPLNPGTFFTGIHESKLLNAVKFTGRTKGNWRVGAYHATLGPVKAEVTNFLSSSSISRETITYQNLSAYNYLSAEYIFPNNSYARVSNAAMLAGRDMNTFLPGADFRLRNHANTLEISGNALMTLQTADTARWQGYAYNLALSRINRRWGWSVAHEARSPEYSPFLLAPLPLNSFRGSSSHAVVNYRDFQPRGPWLNRGARLGLSTFWSVRPGEQNVWTIVSTFHALDRRFRRFTLGASLTPHNQIFRYENGGANLSQKVAPRAGLQLGFITDTRRRFSV